MKRFKSGYIYTTLVVLALLLVSFSDDDKVNAIAEYSKNSSSAAHTYAITLGNGDVFKGEVPTYTGGVFYHAAFVEYDEATNSNMLVVMLSDAGKCNIGIGFRLDENNQPIPESNASGISFGAFNGQKIYTPKTYTVTLKNYQKHTINYYGEEATIASFTLHFEGAFANSLNDEVTNGSGSITIAAP